MDIHCGAIVWAEAPDRNGFIKDRPMVVISIDADPAEPFVCCCITTKDKKPRPDTYMRIPWDARGVSASGLTEPSFAVANWIIEVKSSDVRRIAGNLNIGQLGKLLALISDYAEEGHA